MEREGLDGFMVRSRANRFWLTGFSGSEGLVLVTAEKVLLLTDFRYTEQARGEAPGAEVVEVTGLLEYLGRRVASYGLKRVGFEAGGLTYKEYREFKEGLKAVELVPTEDWIEDLRAVKDGQEVEDISRAVSLADRAFTEICRFLKPGISELEAAAELEYIMKRMGASGPSFPTIVVAGPRSSMAHASPTDRPLGEGEPVLMDFGARVGGYCSDITRTLILGRNDGRFEEIYEIVLAAQKAALEALAPRVSCRKVDETARKVIEEAGYGENFGHAVGHGVGIEIHEKPRLSQRSDRVLAPGMVVTVEPGIYIPGWGGIRIEDMAVITPEGYRRLTTAPKNLTLLGQEV